MTTCRLARSLAHSAVAAALLFAWTVEPAAAQPLPGPMGAGPRTAVDIGYFYDALDPYGDWVWVEPYGWAWIPNSVAPFWRPYTVGTWEWTDWGWTFVSSERWGWATYHYGRWVRANRHGWAWVPGNVWGPAWVAWRRGPGVVGWAPLPPEVRFRADVGLDWGGIDIDVALGFDSWCFVDEPRFADPDVYRRAYPVGRNATVIRVTRDVTRVRVVGDRILDEGIDREAIERASRRAIPTRRVVDNPRSDRRPAEVVADQIRVFRPEVRPQPPAAAPRRGRKPEAAPPPDDPWAHGDTVRRWDRNWNHDWDKLERIQRRDEPVRAAPPQPSRPGNLERVRDENMAAAENAYRELVAERERATRRAERKKK